MDSSSRTWFRLHTYYRSSCSGRLRIALNIKSIPAEYAYVHLGNGEQRSPNYHQVNPSGTVPVLTHLSLAGLEFPITQSIAALEYLEEVFPESRPLLPPQSEPLQRAKVRTLMNVIACDTQPITNRSIGSAVTDLGASHQEWQRKHLGRGLQAYEDIAAGTTGTYSVGDEVSMADVCLVPCVWNAEVYDIDLSKLPTVRRIYGAMMELEAVKKAHWKSQPDTPPDGAWL